MAILPERESWSEREFGTSDFGDVRLTERLKKISEQLSADPQSPINGAMNGDWGATKGAYRFFANPKVTPTKILIPHREATLTRLRQEKVVLAIQDTTYLNFNGHAKCDGLGFIGTEKLRGVVAHTTLCCSTDGLPLGIMDQKLYTRDSVEENGVAKRKRLPIALKESSRWLDSQRIISTLDTADTEIVTVCDREGDITQLLFEAAALNMKYIIRSSSNRTVTGTDAKNLYELVASSNIAGNIKIPIAARGGQKAQIVDATVQYVTTQIASQNKKFGVLTVSLIRVKSISGTQQLEWNLLTNLPVENFKQVVEKISWYKLRWHIEQFHKILKSGCAIEKCRLGTTERLYASITLYSIIAWRLFNLTMCNRLFPLGNALMILSAHELSALQILRNKSLNSAMNQFMSVAEATRAMAKLGGFLARKNNGEPGIITVWRGWNKVNSVACAL